MRDTSKSAGMEWVVGGAGCSLCVLETATSSSYAPPSLPVYEVRDQPLQAMLVMSDGGAFSSEYSSKNVFNDDRTVYCTLASEGVNVVAQCPSRAQQLQPQHAVESNDSSPFLMTSIVVRVPPTGFTSPMGQAVIFTSWDYPDLEAIKHFDAVSSQQDFDRLVSCYGSTTSCSTATAAAGQSRPWTGVSEKELADDSCQLNADTSYMAGWYPVPAFAAPGQPSLDWSSPQPSSPSSRVFPGDPSLTAPSLKEPSDASRPLPRMFIDMGQSCEGRFVLPSPVSGRFVVIKMLRAKYSHADNIDIQYIGLRGYTSPPCFGAGIMV